MAEPAGQRDPVYGEDDSRPVTGPDLAAQEGITNNTAGGNSPSTSSSTGSRAGGATSGTGGGGGGASSSTAANDGGATSGTGETPADIRNREEGGGDDEPDDDTVGRGYTPGNSSSTRKGKVRFRITRRRAAIAGVGTTTIVGSLFALFSISSGPFQFVQLAHLLEEFHFTSQEDAENSRLEKIVRYVQNYNMPERSRMGIVGNAIADKLESKIYDSTGLKPAFDKNGKFLGYYIDPDDKNFQGYSDDEIRQAMAQELDLNVDDIGKASNVKGVSKEVNIYNPDRSGLRSVANSYYQKSFARALFTKAGFNRVSGYIASRVLETRANWGFTGPIKGWDAAYQAYLRKLAKAAYDKVVGQDEQDFDTSEQAEVSSDTSPPELATEDPNEENSQGQPVADGDRTSAVEAGTSAAATPTEGNIRETLKGGISNALGVVCQLEAVNSKIYALRYVKVIWPMMRFAGQIITLGSEVQSGQNITATQLGFFNKFLHKTDSNGKDVSDWDQARSIEAELGESQTGPDLKSDEQVFNKGVPFGFADAAPVKDACSALGSPLGQIASFIIAPFQSLFQTFVLGPAVIGPLSSAAAGWLSGAPINILKSAGADDGNIANYGARLSANAQFASAGGVALSDSQEADVNQNNVALDNQEFQSKSLAYRIFDPDDPQTLASRVMDNYNGGVKEDFADMFDNFGSIFSSTLKSVGSIFSGVSHAASQPYDYHGLQAWGFSTADLTNPAYDNPFENACRVVGGPGCDASYGNGLFGDPNNPHDAFYQQYSSRISTCFGDTVTFDTSQPDGGAWVINFTNNDPVDMYSPDAPNDAYTAANCSDSSPDWTAIRFWLMDTQTIEGYDCYDDTSSTSAQSCQDIGVNSGSSGSSSETSGTTGTGTGKFTTNTSITYPGLQKMLARVNAATSSASGAAAFCASIGGCAGKCESAVEMAWLGHRGVYEDPFGDAGDTPAAGSAWAAALASGHAHPGDRNPPVGALLIYNHHDPSDPLGHITIYLGNNQVFSTDFDHPGSVGIDSASDIETGSWANSYVGWMDPYFSGQVGD